MTSVPTAVALMVCALLGTLVVLARDPLRQAQVATVFGVSLVAVFVLLQAPDVALSAAVVAGAASPLLTVLALARIRVEQRRRGDGRR